MKVNYDCSGTVTLVSKIQLEQWFIFKKNILDYPKYSEITENNIFQKKKDNEGRLYYISLAGNVMIVDVKPDDEAYLIELEIKWRFK